MEDHARGVSARGACPREGREFAGGKEGEGEGRSREVKNGVCGNS